MSLPIFFQSLIPLLLNFRRCLRHQCVSVYLLIGDCIHHSSIIPHSGKYLDVKATPVSWILMKALQNRCRDLNHSRMKIHTLRMPTQTHPNKKSLSVLHLKLMHLGFFTKTLYLKIGRSIVTLSRNGISAIFLKNKQISAPQRGPNQGHKA